MKEVLVISEKAFELTTELVMDWLISLGNNVTRVNGDDFEKSSNFLEIYNSDCKPAFKINNRNLNLSYDSVWFRRWSRYDDTQDILKLLKNKSYDLDHALALISNRSVDNETIFNFFFRSLECKKILTNVGQTNVNKLEVLTEAQKLKINVPPFLLTNSKVRLLDFISTHSSVIVKDINRNFIYHAGDHVYLNYTHLITAADLEEIPDTFGHSFFQKYIEKSFEIRSFFLDDQFYSMAIFSQNNEQTKIDFRDYDFAKPNRTVPYNLPADLESQIRELMSVLNLKTGSIDLIKDENDSFYFLEVNPVGQFGMVSGPCNYPLELEIAKYLSR